MDHNSSLLDVGCGKGFTLFDFCKKIPQIRIRGLEISQCHNNSLPVIRPHIDLGCCSSHMILILYLAISITTIHNLDKDGVKRSLKELIRVSKRSYIKVNGFSELDNKKLNNWNLVIKQFFILMNGRNYLMRLVMIENGSSSNLDLLNFIL